MTNQPDHRSYAVVIGVNGAGIFSTAESNAQAVAETLASPTYRFTTFTLTGSQATRSAVLETLQRFRQATPSTRILVYFAGHCFPAEDDAGSHDVFLQIADDLNGEPGIIALGDLLALGQIAPTARLAFILDTPLPENQPLPDNRQPDQAAHYSLLTGRMDHQTGAYYPITGPLLIALSSAARRHAPGEQPYTVDDLAQHLKQHMAAAYGQNGRFDLFRVGDESDSFSLLVTLDEATRQRQQALRFPPPPGTLREGQRQHRKPSRLSQWADALIERVGLTPIVSTSIIAGMLITAILVAVAVFIGRYSLKFAVVPRNQPTATPTPVFTLPAPNPYPTPTPIPPATYATPFPPFGNYIGQPDYLLITVQQVGNIPPGEPVRISSVWFDPYSNEWIYRLVAQNEQLTGEATVWQFVLIDNYNIPTPTAIFMTGLGGYPVVTLERVGDIPIGTAVRVSSAGFDHSIGWTYTIVAEDGSTAEAQEHQLAFKPGVDPFAPTPTARYLTQAAWYPVVTLEQVGDIPAGTRVTISHAWYEVNGWMYGVTTDDGVYAEAREDQLSFMPTPTPNRSGTPTPTPSALPPPSPTISPT